jgi:hypothetical protein
MFVILNGSAGECIVYLNNGRYGGINLSTLWHSHSCL